MAKDTKATAPTAPTAPTATPPVTPPVTPPATEPTLPKVKGDDNFQWFYPTADEAKAAAAKREKGPRKAITIVDQKGKTHHVVAFSREQASMVVLLTTGCTVTEIGAKERRSGGGKTPELDIAAMFSLIMAKPEAERNQLIQQLASKGVVVPTPSAKS